MSIREGRQGATRTDAAEAVTGGLSAGARPPVPSAFPNGDDSLSRTLVYDHPRMDRYEQILITVWASGEIDVAMRAAAGATWGPPWILKEVESW